MNRATSSRFELPELILPPVVDGVQVGTPRLRWHGNDLDLPTLEPWLIRAGDAELTSVTIRIPVNVVSEGL